ncbi:MAG: flagellar basal body rod protein FlgC [bacterium]
MFDGFAISVSGMEAEQRRLRVIASNLANANSTRSAAGETYRRQDVLFAAVPLERDGSEALRSSREVRKVAAVGVVEDPRPLKRLYMPSHPDADEKGFVEFPNVEPFEEVVHMMDAVRCYEANVMSFNASKEMLKRALEIGR